jgi:hypothetical protein
MSKLFTIQLPNGETSCCGLIPLLTLMIISELVAPPTGHVHSAPPPQPQPARLDAVDERIIEALRIRGRYGAGVWELINALADADEHGSRAKLRAARVSLWHRLRSLLGRDVIFRQGRKRISLFKLPTEGVSRRRRKRAGSTSAPAPAQHTASHVNHLISNLLDENATSLTIPPIPHKTQCAYSPPRAPIAIERLDGIRRAAIDLAKLPRGVKRRLSGYVGSLRPRVGQPIRLADGTKAFFGGAKRGQVLFFLNADYRMERGRWGFVRSAAVRLVKNESAEAVGRAKRGRVE